MSTTTGWSPSLGSTPLRRVFFEACLSRCRSLALRAREVVVPARAPCVCRRCSASPAPRAAILRPLGVDSRNLGSPEQAHDVNALSMLWDAKVCRAEYFESADPAIWRSCCKMFSKVARCCVAKPYARGRVAANAEIMRLMISPRPLASRTPCRAPIVENGWQGNQQHTDHHGLGAPVVSDGLCP